MRFVDSEVKNCSGEVSSPSMRKAGWTDSQTGKPPYAQRPLLSSNYNLPCSIHFNLMAKPLALSLERRQQQQKKKKKKAKKLVGSGPDRPDRVRRCSRVRVRRVAVPKNIQPARTKCSWTTTLTGKLSSFGFDPRRSSNFSFCFSTVGLSLTARAEAKARHASIAESCLCHKLLLNPSNFFIWSGGPVVSEETRAK